MTNKQPAPAVIRIQAHSASGRTLGSPFVVPTNDPAMVFNGIKTFLGGLAVATQRKQQLCICVVPPWKAWIIQHILRCTK